MIKYQANSPCVIMSVTLMTTLFYKALKLQGEIWCWSLLGLKGLCHNCLVYFVYNASYAFLLALKLEKLPMDGLWTTKSQLCVKQTMSPKHNINISIITNNKNELWKTVRLISFQKPQLQSVSIFVKFVHPFFLFYLLCYLYIPLTFRAVILHFH